MKITRAEIRAVYHDLASLTIFDRAPILPQQADPLILHGQANRDVIASNKGVVANEILADRASLGGGQAVGQQAFQPKMTLKACHIPGKHGLTAQADKAQMLKPFALKRI